MVNPLLHYTVAVQQNTNNMQENAIDYNYMYEKKQSVNVWSHC